MALIVCINGTWAAQGETSGNDISIPDDVIVTDFTTTSVASMSVAPTGKLQASLSAQTLTTTGNYHNDGEVGETTPGKSINLSIGGNATGGGITYCVTAPLTAAGTVSLSGRFVGATMYRTIAGVVNLVGDVCALDYGSGNDTVNANGYFFEADFSNGTLNLQDGSRTLNCGALASCNVNCFGTVRVGSFDGNGRGTCTFNLGAAQITVDNVFNGDGNVILNTGAEINGGTVNDCDLSMQTALACYGCTDGGGNINVVFLDEAIDAMVAVTDGDAWLSHVEAVSESRAAFAVGSGGRMRLLGCVASGDQYDLVCDEGGALEVDGTFYSTASGVVGTAPPLDNLDQPLSDIPGDLLGENIDSTGGTAVSLGKAVEVLLGRAIGVAQYDGATGLWTIKGRDGLTTIATATMSSSGTRTASVIV